MGMGSYYAELMEENEGEEVECTREWETCLCWDCEHHRQQIGVANEDKESDSINLRVNKGSISTLTFDQLINMSDEDWTEWCRYIDSLMKMAVRTSSPITI